MTKDKRLPTPREGNGGNGGARLRRNNAHEQELTAALDQLCGSRAQHEWHRVLNGDYS